MDRLFLFLQKFSKNSGTKSNSYKMSEIIDVDVNFDAFEDVVIAKTVKLDFMTFFDACLFDVLKA
jgi:hypothetical protein